MKIAVVGCGHGELDKIYASIQLTEKIEDIKVDLVIINGDFQAIRHEQDLSTIACPAKYLQLGSFPSYFSGSKTAPYPTLFIGGNHEASHYLWELYHGGFAAPNIYFLGFSGVIKFGGIRIGGISGIYKSHDYSLGHHEKFPYTEKDKRSIYHVRKYCVYKLAQIKEPLDIFLSHDWPQSIVHHGNLGNLLRRKPFLRDEIQSGTFGSPANKFLLERLMPKYWFSAHMHVKFAAIYKREKCADMVKENPMQISSRTHSGNQIETEQQKLNPDEIAISDDEEVEQSIEGMSKTNPEEIIMSDDDSKLSSPDGTLKDRDGIENNDLDQMHLNNELDLHESEIENIRVQQNNETFFLALDKCLPGRDFLQIIDVVTTADELKFEYDREWLAIIKTATSYFSRSRVQKELPSDEEFQRMKEDNRKWIDEHVTELKIPSFGSQNAISHEEVREKLTNANAQTEALCALIGISNQIDT